MDYSLFKRWNKAERQQWQDIAKNGRGAFLLTQGVIKNATVMFIFLCVGFVMGSYSGAITLGINSFVVLLLTSIASGIAIAYSQWQDTAKAYKSLRGNQ